MSTAEQTHSLASPVYIVLGATGGIGSALCHRLAARGAHLVLGARDPVKLETLAHEIGGQACALDATETEAVNRCVTQTVERYGRLDGIANCVGSLLLKPAHLTSDAEWNATLAANLGSAFAMVRAAARAMMQTGGAIVLVSSVAARLGLANFQRVIICYCTITTKPKCLRP